VPPTTGHDGYAIARTALALRGIPYRLGGADPGGFDCSGLVQYIFALHGLGLPRVVRDQYRYGIPVELDDLAPGDLVFFETPEGEVSHVGIALGGDQFVHAPNSRGTVRINRLTSGYWGERAIGGRRLVAGTTATQ
jgi:cell wall-associated NlpC family hydrolase